MNPRNQPGSPRSLWHAALAALLLTAATLPGCNELASTNQVIPEAGPDPSYRDIIASYLKTTFKDYSSYEAKYRTHADRLVAYAGDTAVEQQSVLFVIGGDDRVPGHGPHRKWVTPKNANFENWVSSTIW